MKQTPPLLMVFVVVAGLLYGAPAHAYLDPGTGSIILQGLLAGIAGAVVVAKLYWQRITAFFSAIFSTKKPTEQNSGVDDSPEK
ncbi:MAG: hypothetical protein V3U60_09510 [Gammaproteobacteria bacterium]|jgi:hypothetical protein